MFSIENLSWKNIYIFLQDKFSWSKSLSTILGVSFCIYRSCKFKLNYEIKDYLVILNWIMQKKTYNK